MDGGGFDLVLERQFKRAITTDLLVHDDDLKEAIANFPANLLADWDVK